MNVNVGSKQMEEGRDCRTQNGPSQENRRRSWTGGSWHRMWTAAVLVLSVGSLLTANATRPSFSLLANGRKRQGALLRLRGGGLLVKGTPLAWEDSLQWLSYVREHGVLQFIHTFNQRKDRSNEKLLWGEELEYPILKVDKEAKTVKMSMRGDEVLETLRHREEQSGRSDNRKEASAWHPEYGSWMVEGTPRMPFGGFVRDLRRVELSMRLRRRRLIAALEDDEIAPSVTAFPLMGLPDTTHPPADIKGPVAQSDLCTDALINPHPRFATLTANIRKRRGRKVNIKVPLYIDTHTDERLQKENMPNGDDDLYMSGLPDVMCKRKHTIEMDAMCFGMGMCCLQVTFQARDIQESRHLYDQLAVLTPIMLALSAATPILKGRLADTDVRWATIAASVDDRTPQERGLDICEPTHKGQTSWMAGGGKRRLEKSRYESISSYICNCKAGAEDKSATNKYNDIDCPVDENAMATLLAAGVDKTLARHVAHLFVRDPLVIFSERIHLADSENTDHFENIQSTNWQTVRWKPPPPNSDIGWRVEFRSMEAQLTDFENAALTVMTVLLSRVLLYFRLNLYVPLSKVDENMATAHTRDAVLTERFWFRKHMADVEADTAGTEEPEYELMTISEILTGKGAHFPGLLPLVFAYLDSIGCDTATRDTVRRYAKLLEKRATGQVQTTASFIRHFVKSHPAYKHDSVVSQEIAHDLMMAGAAIGEGRLDAPQLLGDVVIEPIYADGAYEVPLESVPLDLQQRNELIEKYSTRAESDKQSGKTVSDGWSAPAAAQASLHVSSLQRSLSDAALKGSRQPVRREWSREDQGTDGEVDVLLTSHGCTCANAPAGSSDEDSDEVQNFQRTDCPTHAQPTQ